MAGFLGLDDPQNVGLLSAGLAMLSQANGPNSRGALGQGALLGLGAYQNAREGQAVEQYRTAQAQRLQQQGAMDQAKASILQRFAGGGQPGAVQGGGLLGMSQPEGQPGGLLAGAVPAGSPSAMPQQGGSQGFPLSLNDVMQLKMAGIDVFDQYKYANDGIKREAGATYQNPVTGQMTFTPKVGEGQELVYGANGPMVRALPGYSSAQAQAAGATAGATAAATLPYQITQDRDRQATGASLDMVAVPDGKGGMVNMPRNQAVAALGTASQAPGTLGTVRSPQMVEAQSALPKVEGQIDSMIGTIDQALKHPGKKWSVGAGSMLPTAPGTPQADFRVLNNQIRGQTFLQAYESLRGAGAITDVETKSATEALARLDPTQSPKAYDKALGELKTTLETARERARTRAGSASTSAPQSGVNAPRSAQEFQSLPSGAVFRAPDGSIRRKP